MSVYEDMASDAGYSYETEENKMFAMMLEQEEMEEFHCQMEEKKAIDAYREILYRDFSKVDEDVEKDTEILF